MRVPVDVCGCLVMTAHSGTGERWFRSGEVCMCRFGTHTKTASPSFAETGGHLETAGYVLGMLASLGS